MITSELLDYIRSSLAAGQDAESIKSELRTTGWIDSDINTAFDGLANPHLAAGKSAAGARWHMGKREIIMGLAALLILGGAASAGAYYLIPPSPEKLLKIVGENMEGVMTFDFTGKLETEISNSQNLFSLPEKLGGGRIAGAGDSVFTVNFFGSADVTDAENLKSRTTVNFNFSPMVFGLEIRTIDRNYYMKVNQLPDLGDYKLSQLANQWMRFTEEDMGQYYPNDGLEDLTEHQKERLESLKADGWLKLDKLKDDALDNQKMYHYSYTVDPEVVKNYLLEASKIENNNFDYDTFINNITISPGELWVGKKDKLVHKITGKLSAKPQSNQPSGSLKWELGMNNFNQAAPIMAPSNYKDLQQVIEEIMAALPAPPVY